MRIDARLGLLEGAHYVPSPNQDERPPGTGIELLIVHGISLPPGEFGGPWVDALFTNRLDSRAHPYFRDLAGLRVSSHLLIRRDGEVRQYVPFQRRAWHAGASSFQGRSRCNDFSIGAELEGADELAYEPIQYRVLAAVCAALIAAYPALSTERIVGHSDVAPGRKNDPGPAFDWGQLHALLAARLPMHRSSGS
jgi:AmpD protein